MMMTMGQRRLENRASLRKEMRAFRGRFLAAAVAALVGVCLVVTTLLLPSSAEFSDVNQDKNQLHKHTIPTVLSVVQDDPFHDDYVLSLENPLYESLDHAKLVDTLLGSRSIQQAPELHVVESQARHVRDPLTLSWTLGKYVNGDPIVTNDDVLILYCGGDQQLLLQKYAQQLQPEDEDVGHFLDAATIGQARATHRKHNNGVDQQPNENIWHFPSFPVLRQDTCQFALFKQIMSYDSSAITLAILAVSEEIHMIQAQTTPTAVHLALGQDATEMVVQFKTGYYNNATRQPVVQFHPDGSTKQVTMTGTSHTYTATDMCQGPATDVKPGKFIPPGILHVVRLAGLDPNTTYHYRAGLQEDSGATTWSEEFAFASAPVLGDDNPFSFIIYGDQGCPSVGWGQGGKWIADMTAREVYRSSLPIRAVHHFGDLSYARGAAHIWDDWLQMNQAFASRVPLMVGVGNHEYDHTNGGQNGKDPSGVTTPGGYKPRWGNFGTDSGGECGVPTASHFIMPHDQNSNGVFWYSFDFATVHTVAISSEHNLTPGSTQYKWLENDLATVNRTVTPWVVLELHRPLYESEALPRDYAVGMARRKELDDLLRDKQVDLVLGGHYHSYQRTCDGLHHAKCNSGGPTHITVGSAGAKLSNCPTYPNSWTEKFIKGEYGYGRITIANASAMHFEFVKAGGEEDPTSGNILDKIWIYRDAQRLKQLAPQQSAVDILRKRHRLVSGLWRRSWKWAAQLKQRRNIQTHCF